ncbi:hypothetical protein QE152_g23526 [Popillia japonica]|uniref:Uncharacterized protein n=1 Tax=Popillia japonica TaxID=7064 RepID=A0AAW1KGI7_POPJA
MGNQITVNFLSFFHLDFCILIGCKYYVKLKLIIYKHHCKCLNSRRFINSGGIIFQDKKFIFSRSISIAVPKPQPS